MSDPKSCMNCLYCCDWARYYNAIYGHPPAENGCEGYVPIPSEDDLKITDDWVWKGNDSVLLRFNPS